MNELSNDTSKEVDTETPADASAIETLADLLAQDESEAETPGGDENGTADGSQNARPTKFNDLAGALDIELDELYALEITGSDGEAVTIEQLKDMHATSSDMQVRELEFEERRAADEAKLMQAQTELREIIQSLPQGSLKPEMVEKIRAKHDSQVKLERERTLEVIPEWQDEEKRTAEVEGIAEHLAGYGFPVNYLSSVIDHRQLKYIRDNWLRHQRIQKALKSVKSGTPKPLPAGAVKKGAPKKKPLAGVKRGSSPNKLHSVFSELG